MGYSLYKNNKKQAIDGKTSARYTGIIGDFPDGFRQKERISMLDVLIIGAGVSGCAAARELSRCKADILVLDKPGLFQCHEYLIYTLDKNYLSLVS